MIPLKDENRAGTVPVVTVGLVALNVFVFGYVTMLGPGTGESLTDRFSVVPARLFDPGGPGWLGAALTPVSYMFLHGGMPRLAFDMLFLWVFGERVEDGLGHLRFLGLYLACGVAAALLGAAAEHGSTFPLLGASGAVSGVLGAYILMYPGGRVWTYFFPVVFWRIIRLPAVVFIGVWVLLQVVSDFSGFGRHSGGMAWFAIIGGIFAGAVLARLFAPGGRGAGRRTGRLTWRKK